MRSTFLFLAASCLLGALCAVAHFPDAVKGVPEAEALWDHLVSERYLPKGIETPELRNFDFRSWHSFLSNKGLDIISDGRVGANSLRRYAKDPTVATNKLHDPYSPATAAELIRSYAEDQRRLVQSAGSRASAREAAALQASGSAPAVGEAVIDFMQMPDDDKNLLIDNPNHGKWW
ncbi:uncharacterized protein SRS1_25069 [Sporisorium reilianum f. sp. reilianum]|uniref:Uncharacterized protein n=1 Tax=Sporisorium reilianum f. sp. reilianum TaxID=72559 RepID=A0A2N8UCL3_9BASI|nr:uncharacterized protein SRS1_25069 [Sporisorium reilianum f. sp. reilianum]